MKQRKESWFWRCPSLTMKSRRSHLLKLLGLVVFGVHVIKSERSFKWNWGFQCFEQEHDLIYLMFLDSKHIVVLNWVSPRTCGQRDMRSRASGAKGKYARDPRAAMGHKRCGKTAVGFWDVTCWRIIGGDGQFIPTLDPKLPWDLGEFSNIALRLVENLDQTWPTWICLRWLCTYLPW